MNKSKWVLVRMTSALLVFGAVAALTLGGCPTPDDPVTDPPTDTPANTPVSALDLTALFTGPVKGATPVTAIATLQYEGSIVWQSDGGTDVTENFAEGGVYKAVVTLTAKAGFTFDGVGANSFVYTGATVTNAADSGTVTITFPAAAALNNVSKVGDYLANASGGTEDNPVSLPVQLNIANDWGNLLNAIDTANKKVALDLSGCTMTDTEFDPGTANTGEKNIVSLVLPDAATSIKKGGSIFNSAFGNFAALKSVSGKNVRTVGEYAFSGRTILTTVDFPAVTSIGDGAFRGCWLTSVDLPAVTTIGNGAFSGCTKLTKVDLPATLTSIGDNPFSSCTSLSEFTVASENLNYKHSSDNKMLLSKDGTTLIAYAAGAGEVTLDDATITTIGPSAFSGCTMLTTVDLSTATSIGHGAFIGCTGLTTVDLPAATAIGGSAFYGCTMLTTVALSAATSIGDRAFYECTSIQTSFKLWV
jgi:hypothetical protein